MDTLPICSANSKQSGQRCKNFAVKGKSVCHIHGGKSKGAKSSKGRMLQKMASWKDGSRSSEAQKENFHIHEMIKRSKRIIEGF